MPTNNIIIPKSDEVQCYTCYKWLSWKECGVGFPPVSNCEGPEVWYCRPCHEEHLSKCGKCWKNEDDCECSCDCIEGSYIDPDCITTCEKCNHRTRLCAVECEWCVLQMIKNMSPDKRTPSQQKRLDDFIAMAKHLGVAS